jgi:hypothetical protein
MDTRLIKRACGAAAAVALVGALSACGADASPAAPSAVSSTSPGTGQSSSASPSPSYTQTVPDPIAPDSYAPAKRGTSSPRPTVKASPGGFTATKAVRYSDGVVLSVTKVTNGKETGQGPGAFPGRPYTLFTMTLENGSTKALDARQVVVTLTYGTPARLAPPVYTNLMEARDFGTVVKPGADATAAYAFAVPSDEAGAVALIVDLDTTHVPARFTGSLP